MRGHNKLNNTWTKKKTSLSQTPTQFLLNNNEYPAYKGQICVYNQIIGKIQGYEPSCAYILGRRVFWNKNKKKEVINSSFNRFPLSPWLVLTIWLILDWEIWIFLFLKKSKANFESVCSLSA